MIKVVPVTQAAMNQVDVDKVLKDKNPRLSTMLPGFVFSYLKRIIHQDELNEVLNQYGHLKGLEFVKASLNYMKISYTVKGAENIPEKGRFLFASNHPLGGLDGIVFLDAVGKIFPDIKFPVNDMLLNVKSFEGLFLPINKHGKQAKESARLIEEAYASNAQILYFPAGLCSRKQGGEIKDLEWKKNFLVKAIKHKRDIIPVHFSGKNSNFFYRLANFRKFTGIKANFEMLYLPNEMFKQKGKDLEISFGPPILHKTILESDLTPQEWSDKLRDLVHDMT